MADIITLQLKHPHDLQLAFCLHACRATAIMENGLGPLSPGALAAAFAKQSVQAILVSPAGVREELLVKPGRDLKIALPHEDHQQAGEYKVRYIIYRYI